MTEDKSLEQEEPECQEPWDSIFNAQRSILNKIECIREMISIILPILKTEDDKRKDKIRKIMKANSEIVKENTIKIAFKSHDELRTFDSSIKRLHIGKDMFRQSVLALIVSSFDDFFSEILRIAYHQNPGWLKKPDKKVSYKDVLEIQSLETFKSNIISKEVDELMRNSHFEQISFLDNEMKLGISREFPHWLAFLELTERRNLYMHTGGEISSQYIKNCTGWGVKLDERHELGKCISTNDDYLSNALDCVYELCVRITQAFSRRLFEDCFDKADIVLHNFTIYELLLEKQWALAERICSFALTIPDKCRKDDSYRFACIINNCIAKKFSGKPYKEDLMPITWDNMHPQYHLAVAVLNDQFDEAAKLMECKSVQEKLKENEYKEWPLFKEFRNSPEFMSAYKKIYNRDFNDEVLNDAREIAEKQTAIEENATLLF
jgi:hypothetical protein